MNKSKFWMVFCPENGNPTKRHYQKTLAKEEAERLAARNPGRLFYVLEALESVQMSALVCTKLEEEIPF